MLPFFLFFLSYDPRGKFSLALYMKVYAEQGQWGVRIVGWDAGGMVGLREGWVV